MHEQTFWSAFVEAMRFSVWLGFLVAAFASISGLSDATVCLTGVAGFAVLNTFLAWQRN